MRRETSRVSFLMCPFCVRGQLLSPTTDAAPSSYLWTFAGAWGTRAVGIMRTTLAARVGIHQDYAPRVRGLRVFFEQPPRPRRS
jgi:hypothetical protein